MIQTNKQNECTNPSTEMNPRIPHMCFFFQGGEGSTLTSVDCVCDEPEGWSFASSFFVAPNSIDFMAVFSNYDPSNIAVLSTCVAIVLLWIPCVAWARRADKKDIIHVIFNCLYAYTIYVFKNIGHESILRNG